MRRWIKEFFRSKEAAWKATESRDPRSYNGPHYDSVERKWFLYVKP